MTRRRQLVQLVVAASAAVVVALAAPSPAAPAASAEEAAVVWPVPVPQWFWQWAEWYLGRDEYRDGPLRSAETRPSSAPRVIPPWAWYRLGVIVGDPLRLPDDELRPRASGRFVVRLQRALDAAGYAVDGVDGVFGEKTTAAVVAFKKVHGMERTAAVPPETFRRIVASTRPAPPLERAGTYTYIDLRRQVSFEVVGGTVARVMTVSSGGGYTYTSHTGRTAVARTPTGTFRVTRKIAGWRQSYLGRLYYPVYFTGPYAVHGSHTVPPRPVSHGCVRIPMWFARDFYDRHPLGRRIVVR